MGFFSDLWGRYRSEIISLGESLLISLLVIFVAWCLAKIIKKMITRWVEKLHHVDRSIVHVFYAVVKVVIWILALLIILNRFGVNTAGILTVLGAAGLAVGLAIKDSLSNIAAGLMLFILRPYKSGDYVDCGSVSGTIKEMGLFSTELCTVDGMFVMIPNSVIFSAPVKNYSRNPRRRADISVGIAYNDDLAVALKVLDQLMRSHEKVLNDPAPEVLVSELADNSVNLTLRFWVENSSFWEVYWQIKSQLKPVIEGAGLTIPFPQRVITLASPLPLEQSK